MREVCCFGSAQQRIEEGSSAIKRSKTEIMVFFAGTKKPLGHKFKSSWVPEVGDGYSWAGKLYRITERVLFEDGQVILYVEDADRPSLTLEEVWNSFFS